MQSKLNEKKKPEPGAEKGKQPDAPVTYTFDGRAFVVQPVFKGNSASTLSTVLLRLMCADLDEG